MNKDFNYLNHLIVESDIKFKTIQLAMLLQTSWHLHKKCTQLRMASSTE